MAVRDFIVLGDGELVVVNQGNACGIAAYRHDEGRFTQIGSVKSGSAVREILISTCSRFLSAALTQDSASVTLCRLTQA